MMHNGKACMLQKIITEDWYVMHDKNHEIVSLITHDEKMMHENMMHDSKKIIAQCWIVMHDKKR